MPRQILVVDDDPGVRQIVCRSLEREGYGTVEAENRAAALGILAASPASIALVLSDVMMPQMTGVELEQAVREHWPALPVLLMSGRVTREVIAERSADHPKPILAKPFTLECLVEAVRGALGDNLSE